MRGVFTKLAILLANLLLILGVILIFGAFTSDIFPTDIDGQRLIMSRGEALDRGVYALLGAIALGMLAETCRAIQRAAGRISEDEE
jgi:hypothetical protein